MKWYHLLAGALIVGIICFCLLRWVFDFDFNNSIGAGIAAAIGGLSAEYVRFFLQRKKMKRIGKVEVSDRR